MPGRQSDQRLVFRVLGFFVGLLALTGVRQAAETERLGQQTFLHQRVAQGLVGKLLAAHIRQRQGEAAFGFVQGTGNPIDDDAQVVQPGQPDMALGGEAGFRGAVFAFLEGAVPQHLQQVFARQCWFL